MEIFDRQWTVGWAHKYKIVWLERHVCLSNVLEYIARTWGYTKPHMESIKRGNHLKRYKFRLGLSGAISARRTGSKLMRLGEGSFSSSLSPLPSPSSVSSSLLYHSLSTMALALSTSKRLECTIQSSSMMAERPPIPPHITDDGCRSGQYKV
jgi:hypothetical protein